MLTGLMWSRRVRGAVAVALMVLVTGACVAQPLAPAPGVPPLAPGQARVWFYRVFFPEDSGGMPPVAINGSTVGYARAGFSFYRDVAAGSYNVTVQSAGLDVDQSKYITLAPGAEAYLAIQSDPTWASPRPGTRVATYYVDIEPPNIAAIHFVQARLGTGY
jgi:hypothetical protein